MSEEGKKEQGQKPKTSRLAIASLILGLLSWRSHLEKLFELSMVNFTNDHEIGTKIFCVAGTVTLECVESNLDSNENSNKNCAASYNFRR